MEEISIYRIMKLISAIVVLSLVVIIFIYPIILSKTKPESQPNPGPDVDKNLKSFFDTVDGLENNYVDVTNKQALEIRDAKRNTDIKQISNAIYKYRSEGGKCSFFDSYKDITASTINGKDGFLGVNGKYPSSYLPDEVYPTDPLSGADGTYYYQIIIKDEDCDSYIIHSSKAENKESVKDLEVNDG